MTVTSTTSRWEAVGNGSTTVFPYNNKIFADTDLDVYLDGVLQTLTTHYTVSGAGLTAGGNVTFLTPPASGVSVVIVRDVANDQQIDYPPGGAFPAVSTEDGLDRRTIISQQNNTRLTRALRYRDSDAGVPDGSLPALTALKGKYLRFNDTTGAPEAVDTAPEAIPTIWKSPYDYGATPGEELAADNKPFIDALMDAAKASWNSTYKTYTIMPTGLGKMWNCPGGTRMIDVRQKGMIIRDFQLYLSGSGAIGFDISGSAWVTFENCHVEGDFADEPAVGFLYGYNDSLEIASRISLYNCSTLGAFSKAGRISIASETSLEVGCRWWNGSRSLTAVASAGVDHMGALDDHLGGLTSPNTGLMTAANGHKSYVLHDWGTTQHIRYSRVNLKVTALSKANPCVVTVETGTLAGSGLANGDTICFYPMQGMTELRFRVFTVANISGDTFELSGVDSTGYSTFDPIPVDSGGAGHSAFVRNQTGAAMLLAGIQQLHNGPAYTITYGAPHIIMDIAQTTGVGPSNTASELYLAMQCEVDPIKIMEVHQGSTAKTLQGWNLEILGAAHPVGDVVYDFVDSADVIFHKGSTRITRMPVAPANGLFRGPTVGPPAKVAGLVSLWMHDISVTLAAALNDPDDFALYRVKEIAFDRAPDRLRDYEQSRWYDIPEFVQTTVGPPAARTRLDASGTLAGPFFDLIRNGGTSALARLRLFGDNNASPNPEEIEYGSLSAQILSPTDGAESGRLLLYVMDGGALTLVGYADSNGLSSRGRIVQTQESAAQTALRDITNAINTTRKAPSKMVWDVTNGRPVWAFGSSAGDVWVDADGATVHTPV